MNYILLTLNILIIVLLVILFMKLKKFSGGQAAPTDALSAIKTEILNENRQNRIETISSVQNSMNSFNQMMMDTQQKTSNMQDKKLDTINQTLAEKHAVLQESVIGMVSTLDKRMQESTAQNQVNFENIRKTMETRLSYMQEENGKKLDEMRKTVDEKLQKTLEERIGESFKMVSERLEQVYKGLGEMQNLAAGVGDLKRVLSNVKTRGTLGELQLGAILSEILAPEQYETNVITHKGSKNFVEFAIKLPGSSNGERVYLPIDSKFPIDTYQHLLDAYDSGDAKAVETAVKALIRNIKDSAKEIHEKYIDPPYTTDFAIMFLPVEGLYAEVVKNGMVEELQSTYKINIAGPTTMAALLNSLQMGFRTLAISKRSAEVWNILGAAKTEFARFEDVLAKAQNKLNGVNKELDALIGTRTRKIQKCLESVHSLPTDSAAEIINGNDLVLESLTEEEVEE